MGWYIAAAIYAAFCVLFMLFWLGLPRDDSEDGTGL